MSFSWNLPNTGIEPVSLMSPELPGGFFTSSATREATLSREEELKALDFV